MNKNGFTLIELIVTIGIMALIGLVIGTNMLGMFSKEEDKEYETFKKRIEEAACMYVDMKKDSGYRQQCMSGDCTPITIKELINAGYIEEDLKDPNTGKNVDGNKKVTVNYSDNEKKCRYN